MENILPISLKLNFTPNTLGYYGLRKGKFEVSNLVLTVRSFVIGGCIQGIKALQLQTTQNLMHILLEVHLCRCIDYQWRNSNDFLPRRSSPPPQQAKFDTVAISDYRIVPVTNFLCLFRVSCMDLATGYEVHVPWNTGLF